MTLPKKLAEKREEKADEYVYDCYFSRESEWNDRKIDFKLGFDFACQLLLPEIKNLEKAIQHCEKFDTSGRMGRYGYGEVIRGHKPEPGTRFKTPKEKAREVLQSLRESLGESE